MGQVVDTLIANGYGGYAGWDDTAAAADFNATGGNGKMTGGGGGAAGANVPPPFTFDYAEEAKKAYGELAPYYTQLIQWAQGDMNKILARLTEDYDRGLRVKTENTNLGMEKYNRAQSQADIRQTQANQNIMNNALARGLYQQSVYDNNAAPQQGYGMPDVSFNKSNQAFAFDKQSRDIAKTALNTNLTRYKEQADINRARRSADANENFNRKQFQYEEERKQKSGDIANMRGQRAYQEYINKFSLS